MDTIEATASRLLRPTQLRVTSDAPVHGVITEEQLVAKQAEFEAAKQAFLDTQTKRIFLASLTSPAPFADLENRALEAETRLREAESGVKQSQDEVERVRAEIARTGEHVADAFVRVRDARARLGSALEEYSQVRSQSVPEYATAITMADGSTHAFTTETGARTLLAQQTVDTANLRADAFRLSSAAAHAQDSTKAMEVQIASLESVLARLREEKASTLRSKRTEAERLEEAAAWYNGMTKLLESSVAPIM